MDLLSAASATNLGAARMQMALSLGWHIIVASFGVGFPGIMLLARWRGLRTGDDAYARLARQWARAMGVLFAAGAVSGTVLSFELGLLWPGMMGTYGQVIGLPFSLEGIAFFLEAIFVGIYLYAADKLSPRQHLLSGLPILAAGVSSAFFVVSANAWMNQPSGFDLVNGRVVNIDPWAAMFNRATPTQTVHMILAAFMVTGFLTASVYAVGMLKGRRDRYHRLGLLLPLAVAIAATPLQIGVGDWAGHFVADHEPVKLAAMEALVTTERGAPLHIGGIIKDGEVRYGLPVPKGLSLLAQDNPDAQIRGLDQVAPDDRPPANVVHIAFDLMVLSGFALLGLSLWSVVAWRRRGDLPGGRWFLRAVAASGVVAVVALEAGWTTTEVGRQPWVVYGVLRTKDAVNPAPGLVSGFVIVCLVYAVLTVATIAAMRWLGDHRPEQSPSPQEQWVTAREVT
jgi:cytochrome d ubiquinol oxidase subunit I